jgi:hypothetical protein
MKLKKAEARAQGAVEPMKKKITYAAKLENLLCSSPQLV